MGRTPRGWLRRTRSAQLNRILHRIAMSSLVFLLTLGIGTGGFLAIGEGHATLSDAIYMTLITVSTVGYSEVVPLVGPGARIFAGVMAIVGFGIITFLFTSLTLFFLESDLDLSLRRRRMEKRIGALRGHYIVCGFGRVGRNVAAELEHTQRAFVAIDHLPQQIEDGRQHFPDVLCLAGDAGDDDLLRLAGVANAEGVFAVTGDDSMNLLITITAKQLNPQVRVVARCHELRNVDKLKRVGADHVVSPDFTGGKRIASLMLRPQVVGFLDEMLRSEEKLRVEEVPIEADFAPRTLGELALQDTDFILLAVRTGASWRFNPQADFMLQAGHVLIAMATPQGRDRLAQRLTAQLVR